MPGTHGDLFREIGELVVAAHAGETFDLTEKSEELARRYIDVGVPAETIAKAIARSVGAVGVSLALVRPAERVAPFEIDGVSVLSSREEAAPPEDAADGDPGDATAGLFPSGLRLAVLS